jgi:hypothetical protein
VGLVPPEAASPSFHVVVVVVVVVAIMIILILVSITAVPPFVLHIVVF